MMAFEHPIRQISGDKMLTNTYIVPIGHSVYP